MTNDEKTALRQAVKDHPKFNPSWVHPSCGNIDTCEFKVVYAIAKARLHMEVKSSDRRGRPPKNPVSPVPVTPRTEPVKAEPVPVDFEEVEQALEEIEALPLSPLEQAVLDVLDKHGKTQVDEARTIELIKEHGPNVITRPINIYHCPIDIAPSYTFTEGTVHFLFPLILAAVRKGLHVYLVGPAGSGKTTLAEQIAKALALPCHLTGAVSSEYKLKGFIDAHGIYQRTAFREAFEHGGLFMFDELDGSAAAAILVLNGALANGHCDFPDKTIPKHPNFRVIAAGNTYGQGMDLQYVGRNPLDAASRDRFVFVEFPYDLVLEARMIGANTDLSNPHYDPQARQASQTHRDHILSLVRAIRQACGELAIQHIVSPRASMAYLGLFEAGWPLSMINQAVLYRGLKRDDMGKLDRHHSVSDAKSRLEAVL